MKDWEEVLSYEDTVKSICRIWANRNQDDLYEDAVNHTYIVMLEKVDPTKAVGNTYEYVKGAIWNIAHKFFNANRSVDSGVSLDAMSSSGIQIDENGIVNWPSSSLRGYYE